jgi:cytochrome c-type protein NapC
MAKSSGSSGKKTLIVVGLIFLAGIGFAGLFNVGVAYTNEMDFCTSCHSMQINLEEYKETSHYSNPSGVQATCSDCHVPKQFGPKMMAKVIAAKDVFHEVLGTIDTPEKYEAYRWDMASRVWAKMKGTNSRECMNCHQFQHMNLDEQSRSARNRHGSAEDKGMSCIDCHQGVAHELPDEPEEPEEETQAKAE